MGLLNLELRGRTGNVKNGGSTYKFYKNGEGIDFFWLRYFLSQMLRSGQMSLMISRRSGTKWGDLCVLDVGFLVGINLEIWQVTVLPLTMK